MATPITASTTPIALCLLDTKAKFTSSTQALTAKITALEGLSVSDDRVLCLLQVINFDNIQNLIVSPAIDDIINDAVKAATAPLSQEPHLLKILSSSVPVHPKPKTGFTQIESKDFNISKFIKETEGIKLAGNLLVNLEHFGILFYIFLICFVFKTKSILATMI